MKRSCSMLAIALKALTLAPTSDTTARMLQIAPLIHIPQENISAKIGLILSFSLILIWGARLPVVCNTIALFLFFW
jgi:membrane protein CcdC involved in cytochrome C biogenesis